MTQPAAPHDLVIQHQDYRMYTLPDGTVKHKYGNVYYHPTLPCICAKQPHFDATQIVVSQVVKDQVTPVHHGFILAMLGVIIYLVADEDLRGRNVLLLTFYSLCELLRYRREKLFN